MGNATIAVSLLEKSYKKHKVLDRISFDINHGTITAILGPNGSGKTTLLKCILGLTMADHGKIYIKGLSIQGDGMYRRNIGYMPQIANFPDNLSTNTLLKLLTHLRGSLSIERELIEMFGLETILKRPIRELSGGTKQKINAVCALSFGADILILDEPTVGLDPLSSVRFKEQILKAKQLGKTVLLTSHIMTEVEELADDIIFLLDGSVRFSGTLEEIRYTTREAKLERAIARLMNERQVKVHA